MARRGGDFAGAELRLLLKELTRVDQGQLLIAFLAEGDPA